MIGVYDFAEKYLKPYYIKNGKINPLYCPICHGGKNQDKNTFSLYKDESDRWVYKCLRASCPNNKGTFRHLAFSFNESDGEVDVLATFASKQVKKIYSLPDPTKYFPPTEEIYSYFESRKISKDTVEAFKIKSDANGNIVFPFYENDKLVYVKYRKPKKHVKGDGPKEWGETNAKPILFGLDATSYSDELIITEGQLDCMALYEAGLRNVVSVPGGANNETWIDTCYDQLKRYPSILLFGDGDEPGVMAVQNWLNRLEKSKCRVVEDYPDVPEEFLKGLPPKKTKDANEILFFFGADKLHEMCEAAEGIVLEGLVDIAAVPIHDPIISEFIPSSLKTINYEIGGYAPGDLVLWTGKTGEGKTTIVSQEILPAIASGHKVAWYNSEITMAKAKRGLFMQAAGSDYIDLYYDSRREKDIPILNSQVVRRIESYLSGKLFLCEDSIDEELVDANYLIELFTYAKRRNGCSIMIVDNLMMALMNAPDDTYFRAQEKFTVALKRLARNLNITVHLVAHPRKTREDLTNDDVSGSASITRLCDMVFSVRHGNLKILKDRNEGNKNKDVPFIYYPDSRLVTDLTDDHPFYTDWDRTGIPAPTNKACYVYPKVYPNISGYAV